jgi:hypothetical protein
MRKVSASAVITLIGCVAVAGWVYAQQRTGARTGTLTAQDRDAIEELYARYNQGSDFDDVAMFMTIWADDAVFKPSPKLELKGRKALEEWRTTANAGRKKSNAPPRRHFNSSLIITPTAEGAKGRNYYFLMDVSGKEPRIYGSGYHDDTFVRTANGWRIQTRMDHNDPAE